jgi:hypothetical protein
MRIHWQKMQLDDDEMWRRLEAGKSSDDGESLWPVAFDKELWKLLDGDDDIIASIEPVLMQDHCTWIALYSLTRMYDGDMRMDVLRAFVVDVDTCQRVEEISYIDDDVVHPYAVTQHGTLLQILCGRQNTEKLATGCLLCDGDIHTMLLPLI